MSNDKETTTPTTFGLMKYVHAMFFIGGAIIAWLFVQIIETSWIALNLNIASIPPVNQAAVVICGTLAALALVFYLWRDAKINRLSIEIVTELSKVTWPTRKELQAATVVVIILSVIASIILGLFDFFWSAVTDLIYT